MKWRARLAMLVVTGIGLSAVFIPALNRPWHVSRAIALLMFLGIWGAFYALSFLTLRCPHCRARQLRPYWDWFFIGDRCWQCHQLLDRPSVSPDVLNEQLVAEVNPALSAEMRRDRLELEELQVRARTDPGAAAELERTLATEVDKAREWVAIVRREAPSGERDALRSLARAEDRLAQFRSLPRNV